jgi:ribosomal protein S18 acetylase RimI-like enzyme
VYLQYQRKGYGTAIIKFLLEHYQGKYAEMIVAIGDSPITVPFYESCGFVVYKRLKNYILEHYDHPIFENGIQLFDLVYLKQNLDIQI